MIQHHVFCFKYTGLFDCKNLSTEVAAAELWRPLPLQIGGGSAEFRGADSAGLA